MLVKKINKLFFIDLLFFLSVLFIGADKYALQISGYTFRYVQIFIALLFLTLIYIKKYIIKYEIYLIPFMICFILSLLLSTNIKNGIGYFLWLIFNIFILFSTIISYTRYRGMNLSINILEKSFIIVSILTIMQAIIMNIFKIEIPFLTNQVHKGIYRAALWFYEPSYLATYLTFPYAYYIYTVLKYRNFKNIRNLILVSLALMVTTSSTAYIMIALTPILLALIILFSSNFSEKLKITFLLSTITALFTVFMIIYLVFPHLFSVFIGRLTNITSASGGRINEYILGINLFKEYPLFGVGPNNYGYMVNGNVEYQPTNVTIELLSTLGIFGTLSFYSIYIVIFIQAKRLDYLSRSFAFSNLIFIITLQANQGYMRLYLWLFLALSFATNYNKRYT